MSDPQPTGTFRTDRPTDEGTPLLAGETAAAGPADAPPTDPLPRAFGRYELRRLLGRGGMGRVYLAHDPHLDRLVALKMPNPVEGVAAWRERFLAEARAAATVTHPNVCPVYDVGEVGGQPYLTMAYIEGETLAAKLLRSGPVVPAAAVEVVRVVARAMHEAHRRGIVHRDLKPANLMIDPAGRPVVMDFGLAVRPTAADDLRLTLTGVAMGTPAYMPPEQAGADHDAIGPPADVYALGVILFELVTGRVPFRARTFGQLVAQIERDPPPMPSSLNPAVDPALEAVILTALAKAPTDRFATAGDLADALDRHAQGDRYGLVSLYSKPYLIPNSTAEFRTPADAASVARKPRSRGRVLAWAAVLLAAVAAAGAVIYVETDYGDLEVRLNDPSARVDVRVNGNQVVLTPEGGQPVRVRAGRNQKLEVSGPGYETVAESFDLTRGGKTIVQVTLRPRAGVAKGPPAKPDPNPKPEPKKDPVAVEPPKKDPVAEPPKKDPVTVSPKKDVSKPVPFPAKPSLADLPGWQILTDATKEEMQAWLDERKKAGHSVVWLDVVSVDGKPLYAAVAALDGRQSNWGMVLDLPSTEFNSDGAAPKLMDLKRNELVSLSGYADKGEVRCAALWRTGRTLGTVVPDDPFTDAAGTITTQRSAGRFPVGLRPYPIGLDAPRVAFWTTQHLGGKPAHTWQAGSTALEAFTADARRDGNRVRNVAAYTRDGNLEFAAVAWPNPEKWEWATDTNLTSAELKAKAAAMVGKGFYPECVTAYTWDGAVRYCAVWVKVPPKPVDSPGKSTVVEVPGWQILTDASKDEVQAWLDDRKKNKHSVVWLDAYPLDGKAVYSAVAALDARQTDWIALPAMGADEFGNGTFVKRVDIKNYTIRSISGFARADKVETALLFTRDPKVWGLIPDSPLEDLPDFVRVETKGGRMVRAVRPFPFGPDAVMAAVATERHTAAGSHAVNLSAKELADDLAAARTEGKRPTLVAGYVRSGLLRYALTSVPNNDKLDWDVTTGLTAADLKGKAAELADKGFRPASVAGYAWDGAVRYGVVWVKEPAKKP